LGAAMDSSASPAHACGHAGPRGGPCEVSGRAEVEPRSHACRPRRPGLADREPERLPGDDRERQPDQPRSAPDPGDRHGRPVGDRLDHPRDQASSDTSSRSTSTGTSSSGRSRRSARRPALLTRRSGRPTPPRPGRPGRLSYQTPRWMCSCAQLLDKQAKSRIFGRACGRIRQCSRIAARV
jgi:hypothetical protein